MSDPAEMRMFDLGLAKGMEVQQERIIKLLEFYLGETDWSDYEGDSPNVEWIRGFSAALALIKGEGK